MSKTKLVPKHVEGGVAASVTGNNIGIGGGQNPFASNPTSLNPWALAGKAADTISGFLPELPEYSGDKGAITAGMDEAYNKISDVAMKIPPWGTVAGGAMKVAGALNKGMKLLGAGTDGMTTADAILGSNFLGPIGWINGWGGSKSDTMTKNDSIWAQGGNSYSGSNANMDLAMTKQGKKYGMVSQGAKREANAMIHDMGRLLNMLGSIVNLNSMAMETLANQLDMNNQSYMNSISGGYNLELVHSALKGGILNNLNAYRRAHYIAYLMMNLSPYKPTIEIPIEVSEDDINKFLNGGIILQSVIPEGALHAHKHHLEDVREDLNGEITHKGIPVIDNETGELTAEIEREEIILSKSITDLIEDLRKLYNAEESPSKRDELARLAGEILSNEICENTDDKAGLIDKIEQ